MNRAENILALLRGKLPELRDQYGVVYLGLFGSTLREDEGPGSDIDVLIDFDEAPTLFTFMEVEQELSAQLGGRVDLVMRSVLKPAIGREILREVRAA